jgi:SAM-dependent methyltransferase
MATRDDLPVPNLTNATAFGKRMVAIIDDAATALLLSIGHQTGLFDTLARMPRSTSTQLADAAGLNERYVREWLGGVASSGLVNYHAESATYTMPADHIPALTTSGGPRNVAQMGQSIADFGAVEAQILDCFRHGGGLPYEAYPRFHEVMAERSSARVDTALLDVVLPLVDGLVDRLRAGIDVADIGCGSGHAINVMAKAFPASRFTGYDFSEAAVGRARAESAEWGVSNTSFVVADVSTLTAVDEFDAITVFDAIHDQAKPGQVLANIFRALRPGGALLMVDIKASSNLEDNIGQPFAPLLYMTSTMHCMSVSLGMNGAGLGAMWGEQLALSMLSDTGFRDVKVAGVEVDPYNNYYLAHKR